MHLVSGFLLGKTLLFLFPGTSITTYLIAGLAIAFIYLLHSLFQKAILGDANVASLWWTTDCQCKPVLKTGETLCCNICGKPSAQTARANKEPARLTLEKIIFHATALFGILLLFIVVVNYWLLSKQPSNYEVLMILMVTIYAAAKNKRQSQQV